MSHSHDILANWGTHEACAARAVAFDLAQQRRRLEGCLAFEAFCQTRVEGADKAGRAAARWTDDLVTEINTTRDYEDAVEALADARSATSESRGEIARLEALL